MQLNLADNVVFLKVTGLKADETLQLIGLEPLGPADPHPKPRRLALLEADTAISDAITVPVVQAPDGHRTGFAVETLRFAMTFAPSHFGTVTIGIIRAQDRPAPGQPRPVHLTVELIRNGGEPGVYREKNELVSPT